MEQTEGREKFNAIFFLIMGLQKHPNTGNAAALPRPSALQIGSISKVPDTIHIAVCLRACHSVQQPEPRHRYLG